MRTRLAERSIWLVAALVSFYSPRARCGEFGRFGIIDVPKRFRFHSWRKLAAGRKCSSCCSGFTLRIIVCASSDEETRNDESTCTCEYCFIRLNKNDRSLN